MWVVFVSIYLCVGAVWGLTFIVVESTAIDQVFTTRGMICCAIGLIFIWPLYMAGIVMYLFGGTCTGRIKIHDD